jgi:hypothetical protein
MYYTGALLLVSHHDGALGALGFIRFAVRVCDLPLLLDSLQVYRTLARSQAAVGAAFGSLPVAPVVPCTSTFSLLLASSSPHHLLLLAYHTFCPEFLLHLGSDDKLEFSLGGV